MPKLPVAIRRLTARASKRWTPSCTALHYRLPKRIWTSTGIPPWPETQVAQIFGSATYARRARMTGCRVAGNFPFWRFIRWRCQRPVFFHWARALPVSVHEWGKKIRGTWCKVAQCIALIPGRFLDRWLADCHMRFRSERGSTSITNAAWACPPIGLCHRRIEKDRPEFKCQALKKLLRTGYRFGYNRWISVSPAGNKHALRSILQLSPA
jgi:hypothetical protein